MSHYLTKKLMLFLRRLIESYLMFGMRTVGSVNVCRVLETIFRKINSKNFDLLDLAFSKIRKFLPFWRFSGIFLSTSNIFYAYLDKGKDRCSMKLQEILLV